jgi:hypothetical protein
MYPNLKYIDPKMSSLSLNTLSLTELLNQRSMIDAEIAKQTGGASVVATEPSKGKGKKEKKQSARAGKPTSWSAFSSMLQKEHAEDIKAYKTANPDLKSAHLKWVGDYKDTHAEEYEAFKTKFEAENPKTTVTEVTTVTEREGTTEDATEPSTKEKAKRVLSPEHLAKLKAGREASRAKKQEEKNKEVAAAVAEAPVSLNLVITPAPEAAITVSEDAAPKKKTIKTVKKKESKTEPVVESKPEESQAPKTEGVELPFKIGPSSYIRFGVPNENGETNWLSNDLWLNKRGSRGAYVGELMEDGSINTDAEEPPVVTGKKAWE